MEAVSVAPVAAALVSASARRPVAGDADDPTRDVLVPPVFSTRPPLSIRRQRSGQPQWVRRAVTKAWEQAATAYEIRNAGQIPALLGGRMVPLPEGAYRGAVAALLLRAVDPITTVGVLVLHPLAEHDVLLVRLPLPLTRAPSAKAPEVRAEQDLRDSVRADERGAIVDMLTAIADEKDETGDQRLADFVRACAAAIGGSR